jgi:dihydrofolate reductase
MVTAMAAVARDGTIGDDGGLPWGDLPADLERFRRRTEGGAVVMGRRTHESIVSRSGGALPRRDTVVVSRTLPDDEPGVAVARSPHSALCTALSLDEDPVVAGGESVYRALLPACDTLLITRVPAEPSGDARMPRVDWSEWAGGPTGEAPGGLVFERHSRV